MCLFIYLWRSDSEKICKLIFPYLKYELNKLHEPKACLCSFCKSAHKSEHSILELYLSPLHLSFTFYSLHYMFINLFSFYLCYAKIKTVLYDKIFYYQRTSFFTSSVFVFCFLFYLCFILLCSSFYFVTLLHFWIFCFAKALQTFLPVSYMIATWFKFRITPASGKGLKDGCKSIFFTNTLTNTHVGRHRVSPSTETTARQNRKTQTRLSPKIGFLRQLQNRRVIDSQRGGVEEQYIEFLTTGGGRLMETHAKIKQV